MINESIQVENDLVTFENNVIEEIQSQDWEE